jgi:hypothetical protein
MRKKERKIINMKKFKKRKIKKITSVVYGTLIFFYCQAQYVLAGGAATTTDPSGVTSKLNIVKAVFLAGIATWGVVILAKSIAEFSNAMQQQDNSGMWSAGKGILGGLIMAGISGIITLFAF